MKYIITGDWHLRSDLPRCRIDEDWLLTQETHVRYIFEQATKYDATIVITGDMFHRAVSSVGLANWVIALLQTHTGRILAFPGNHDLPNHAMEKLGGSAYGLVEKTFHFSGMKEPGMILFPFDTESPGLAFGHKIVGMHRLIMEDTDHTMGFGRDTAAGVLAEFPEVKYVVSGDNHQSFVYTNTKGQRLINPGSLNRQSISEMEYKPKIYLLDTELDKVTPLLIPDDIEMVHDRYIVEAKESDIRNGRVRAFAEKVKDKFTVGLSLEDNAKAYLELDHELSDRSVEIVKEVCL